MSKRPEFFIIDGHALAYRQYYGLPPDGFSTRSGETTNAVYGFTRTLMDIIFNERPKYLAVSFDTGMSGREEIYPEYKGTRAKMPDDLDRQMTRIMEITESFNVPLLVADGYEADDIMATIAQQAVAEGVDVRIVTGDKDILQLLSDHVRVQLPNRKRGESGDVLYDEAKFTDEYGFTPEQLLEYKALVGDSSDNIPGVAGVGDKTAKKLLVDYPTVADIYANLDNIDKRTRNKLEKGEELAHLSRKLAAIMRDVPISVTLDDCASHDFLPEPVFALFEELEFRSLRRQLVKLLNNLTEQSSLFGDDDFEDDFAAPAKADFPTIIVQDEETLAALVEELNAASRIAFDTETTSTDQMAAVLVGISLSVDGETGYYIPVGHVSGEQLPLDTVLDALRPPLTNPKIGKVAHNASYDMVVLSRYGLDVSPVTFDTMVAEWLHNPESKNLSLKNLALSRDRLYIAMTEIDELLGRGKDQTTMDQVAIEMASPYAGADAVVTHKLVDLLKQDLDAVGLVDLYNTLEMPLVPVIGSMERAGVALDVDFLGQMSETLDEEMQQVEAAVKAFSDDDDLNLNSPKQLSDLLFNKLDLPTQGVSKTSYGFSTAAHVLENLKGEHEIVDHILQYRELSKLKGTYVDALPALVNPETGRVHTSYNQTGTLTGRISSSNPNLQNIPIRTEIGREVRRAFVAPEGRLLLAVDYSQVELRVMAHVSGEVALLDAFRQGLDIHRATAAIVYDVDLDDVTFEQRVFAKRVNFGVLYGMSAYRLTRDSELTFAEAQSFIDTYFARLPRVGDYLEETKRRAHEYGYVETLLGRRRYFPALKEPWRVSQNIISRNQREAINMPIQGTAADIMKRAMIDLHHALPGHGLDAKMILQVHDELVFEVPEDEIEQTTTLVVEAMEAAYELRASLKVNAQVGKNWRDMESG